MSSHSGSFDTHAHQPRNHPVWMPIIAGLPVIALLIACHSFTPQASARMAAAQSDPQPLNFDACTVFSAADAAQILGVPVRPVTHTDSCFYEAAKETSGGWHRNVALKVFKYKSAAEENSAWGDLRILRHLEPGRKNLTVLSGIGSEAFMQIVPNRNTFEAELWVHKSTWHLRLDSVTEQSPSPEVVKAAAQKIAAKLP